MSDTSGINSTINSNIFTNGVQKITAATLASVLTAITLWVATYYVPYSALPYTTLEQQNVTPKCVADGVTDCLPAMNAAIASLNYTNGLTVPTGGLIRLNSGAGSGKCYYFSASVDTTGKHGLQIEGNGPDPSCVTNGASGNYPIFYNNATNNTPTTHVAIRNLAFNCSGKSNSSSYGISWKYMNDGQIENNYFLGCNRSINMIGAWQVVINKNHMSGSGSQQNGTCLYMALPTDPLDLYHNNAVRASNNVCELYSDYGLRWEDATGSMFMNNQWLGGKKGIYGCDPSSAQFADGTNVICEFVFHYGDQTDTQLEHNVLIKKGSASQLIHVAIEGMWAGSADNLAGSPAATPNLYGVHIEGGSYIQILSLHMSNQEGGVLFKDTTYSRLEGEIIGANPTNDGSYYVLLNGTAGSGAANNEINVTTAGSNRIGYNGFAETGIFGQNRIFGLGTAFFSPTLLLGATVNTPSTANGGTYEITGMKVHAQFFMGFTGALSGTGAATIGGLPVAAMASGSGAAAFGALTPVVCSTGCLSLPASVMVQATQGATTAGLVTQATTGFANLTQANFGTSPTLVFQMDYFKN